MKPNEFTLCILNKEVLQIKDTTFRKNTNYRVSMDDNGKGVIVFGEWMTIQRFNANFVEYIPLLQERLKRLGLIVNGLPVSFKEFKERANIYGRGYINVYIYSHPKENCFAFYPHFTSTKTSGLKKCYDIYVDLVNGGFEYVDADYVRWGNTGLPLGGKLRREELWDEYFKKA